MGTLAITAKGRFRDWLFWLFTPTVVIDGQPQKLSWGWSELPVTSGRHRLDIFVRMFWVATVNRSSISVDVPDGGTVSVIYRTTWSLLAPGRTRVD